MKDLPVRHSPFAIRHLLFAISFLLVSACTAPIARFGIGGRYLEGRDQFLRGRGGNIDTAVKDLESVVRDDPTYKDSLTLLARAYYVKGRYNDALQIVKRALAVNKDDEIAWLVLGLTELRLGQDEKGLETMKGAITLVSRASQPGYRDFPRWDLNGLVRASIRRATVAVLKGLDEKNEIIRSGENILARIDEEENLQIPEESRRQREEF